MTVRTTFSTSVSAGAKSAAARDYVQRGWTVAETTNGLCLITDADVSAVEVTGELAASVRRYLRANNLTGPVIEIPGAERREIHLVTGMRKAERAVEALDGNHQVFHTDGDGIPRASVEFHRPPCNKTETIGWVSSSWSMTRSPVGNSQSCVFRL